MEMAHKTKPSMQEKLRKKGPFFFYNLLTAFLIAYLFLPTIVQKNYYQMFGHNQIISVSIDPAETSTYLSRLIVYEETAVEDLQVNQRAVFYDEIAGIIMPCDGKVTAHDPLVDYFVVTSEDDLTNNISDTNFIGIYKRTSNAFDRYMYFNFKFHWRILTDVNIAITVYVFYYVFFKKEDVLKPVAETSTNVKKNKAFTPKS